LKNDDTTIRRTAAEALGEIGPDAAVATLALAQALKDTDVGVRCLAADSLGQIGPEAAAAVPALREALQDKSLRSAAAGALGAIGRGSRGAGRHQGRPAAARLAHHLAIQHRPRERPAAAHCRLE